MPGRTCLGSTASNSGNSKSWRRGFDATSSWSAEEAMEREEEEAKESGEVDL